MVNKTYTSDDMRLLYDTYMRIIGAEYVDDGSPVTKADLLDIMDLTQDIDDLLDNKSLEDLIEVRQRMLEATYSPCCQ